MSQMRAAGVFPFRTVAATTSTTTAARVRVAVAKTSRLPTVPMDQMTASRLRKMKRVTAITQTNQLPATNNNRTYTSPTKMTANQLLMLRVRRVEMQFPVAKILIEN